jgi:small subunit ribosomal protein S1
MGPDGKPTVVVGSRIAARVVQVDRGTGAVRLSPVSTEPILPSVADAAAAAPAGPATVVAGMRVKGKVVAVERYGVFLEFPVPGAPRAGRGLVPVSELGAPRGADLRKSYPVGSELSATVLSVDDRGRMRLSVTALAAAEERKAFETFAAAGSEDSPDRGAKQGFGTFADLLKRKK